MSSHQVSELLLAVQLWLVHYLTANQSTPPANLYISWNLAHGSESNAQFIQI